MQKLLLTISIFILAAGIIFAQNLTDKEQLGKLLFFDTNLSEPTGQSCATCHAPEVGFTGPISEINNTTVVYPGAIPTRFGNRKPPTAAYGGESPVFYFERKGRLFIGGMFWDGRATGWELGDPLAEQARGPFLNPVEQNLPGIQEFINRVQTSSYSGLFEQVYGTGIFNNPVEAYNKAADAISAYEQSTEVNPFTSKYDYYLKKIIKLSKEEQKGLNLFNGKGKCNNCHISKQGPKGEPPLFTDFTYDNLGIPKNPDNPFYTQPPDINPLGENWIDYGLGEFLETTTTYQQYAAENMGKHKVPTLRNVDKRPNTTFVKAYGHNGFFKTLKDIVHFYNTRDVEAWPPPEVPENVNTAELGNLKLKPEEEDAIVAFLSTLSDGYEINFSDQVELADEVDKKVVILQNSPNPFNPSTTISFLLTEDISVVLKVFNSIGQEVATLIDGYETAGVKSVIFNAADLPSGIYIYRIQAGSFNESKKMLLIK